jgi:hypothetical protein
MTRVEELEVVIKQRMWFIRQHVTCQSCATGCIDNCDCST